MESFTPFLICDTLSSATPGRRCLGAMETGTLPNGCHAYVLSNKTLYSLDKASSVNPTGGIVAAANGGNWVPVSSTGASFGALNVHNNADKTVTLTGSLNYLSLNDAASSYGSAYSGEGWQLSTSTGIATWLGADASLFALTADVTMWNSATVIDTTLAFGLSFGGGPYNPVAGATATSPVATGSSSFYSLSMNRIISVDQGDAIDLLFAGDASVLTVTLLNYTLIPLS